MPDLKFCAMNVLIRFLVDFTPLAFPDHVREYCQVIELLTTTFKERETKFYLGVPFTQVPTYKYGRR